MKAMEKIPSEAVVSAWVRLIRAERAAMKAVEADLKAAGMPPFAWYDVLLELNRAERGALRPYEIEARLLVAQHNVSRLIDRLETVGYVARRPCDADGRGQDVAITPAGRGLLKRMWLVYRAAIQRHVGDKLGDDKTAEHFAALLGRFL
jgi:DNA-binding MarR family transcriptional regulator